jgi:hypothetical protein
MWTTIEVDIILACVDIEVGAIAVYVGGKNRAR